MKKLYCFLAVLLALNGAFLMPSPASAQNEESQLIRYDDGVLRHVWYYYVYDNLIANMFVPTGPTIIDSIMVHTLTVGDDWGWVDGTPDPVGLSIWLDDGSGFPQPEPVFYGVTRGVLGGDIKLDVPEVAAPGAFWAAFSNLPGDCGDDDMGLDDATDYPANKWMRESGTWHVQNIVTGDQMIFCKVFYTPTGIEDDIKALPTEFSLSQNYPNPFNAQTTIQYSLPSQSTVTIDIFDLLGRKIKTLAEGIKPAGDHHATWDANGQSSGVYFYRIKAGDKVETKKMVLMK